MTAPDKRLSKKKLLPMGAYFAKMVPDTWLDPLLSGDKAVLGDPPYTGKDIERLLSAVAERIRRSADP